MLSGLSLLTLGNRVGHATNEQQHDALAARAMKGFWVAIERSAATNQPTVEITMIVSKMMRASLLAAVALAVPATAEEIHELLGPGRTRDISRAQELLRSDPKLVSARDAQLQQTPLQIAARYGPVEMVDLLIRMKADVNATAYNGFTPLHVTESKDIAALLINAGADLDKQDNWGKTPLQKAAQSGLTPVVEAILESGYPCDLTSAVMLGKRDLAIRLVKENPAALKRRHATANLWGGDTPLAVAAGQGDLELVKVFLDAGADVNEGTVMPNAGLGKATALTNAVWGGHKEVVELLLRRGASTEVVGGKFYRTILDYARANSPPEIVSLLENPPR
jgi:ankyrin repeat protein